MLQNEATVAKRIIMHLTNVLKTPVFYLFVWWKLNWNFTASPFM